MKIIFHTKNIDKTFYREIIHNYILEHFVSENFTNLYFKYEKSWTIHIHPSSDWVGTDGRVSNTGTLNGMIPHGVTGEGIVKCYVVDVDDKGLTSLQNFSAICHEIAHMLLIMSMRGIRGTFRNNDLSGNKKGSQANVSTQEVHDRQMEKQLIYFDSWVNIGSWLRRKWVKKTVVGIDLRDFIAARV